ncbi:amino acid ABC transporter permease [Roseomonas chloroacetimidivorans]|uniref:amino acid ABC transporter permease n=1 Tax=Roseomonas chloroacetimidivorans TaxID=1766656 RepID=UPI003C784986
MSGRQAAHAEPGDLTEGLVLDALVPRRHPWRVVGMVVVAILVMVVAHSVLGNPNFQWPVVARYMFHKDILEGVLLTIQLTVTAMLIGTAIGVVVALMGLSSNPLLSRAATLYVAAFRGVPALVQLLFWYNLAALYPTIAISIPFGPTLLSMDANLAITPLIAANLGLGLCEGAFMAEIVRGGILSVDRGQTEAALAVGMSRGQAMRRIILPQAMRVIVPPTGNQVIGMMKHTSLASVISVTELLASSELIYTRTFETIPLLIVTSIWYMALTAVLSLVQRAIERRFARGDRELGLSVGARLREWRARRALASVEGTAGP